MMHDQDELGGHVDRWDLRAQAQLEMHTAAITTLGGFVSLAHGPGKVGTSASSRLAIPPSLQRLLQFKPLNTKHAAGPRMPRSTAISSSAVLTQPSPQRVNPLAHVILHSLSTHVAVPLSTPAQTLPHAPQ
jgi:hypothetical protein